MPHLAKGTDPRFIEAAKIDLSGPTDPKAQHKLGEMWFGLAIDNKDHRTKRAMLGRAQNLVRAQLKAKLEVVDAIKARARIDNISKLDVPSKDPSTLPLFAPVQVRQAYNTIVGDVVRTEWRLEGGAEAKADGIALPGGSPAMRSRFGLAPGGRLSLTLRTDGREVRINCAGQEFAFAGAGKSLRIVIERAEASVKLTATGDEGEPVVRTADLSAGLRGPMFLTVRLTGSAEHPGASMTSAIHRGPASLPLPFAE